MSHVGTFPVGTPGVDSSIDLSSAADALRASGFMFANRTIGYPGDKGNQFGGGVLSPPEVTALQSAGMAIGMFQLFRSTGWSSVQGAEDATYFAEQAGALGAPAGMTLWTDVEGSFNVSSGTLQDYLLNWAAGIQGAGFTPGLYNGPQNLVSGRILGALAGFSAYWRAGVQVEDVGTYRGYQMLQLHPGNQERCGVLVDVDVIQEDNQGDTPTFWMP